MSTPTPEPEQMPIAPTFPWGVHIGDLSAKDAPIDDQDTRDIPVFLPAEAGGFRVAYDDDSEALGSHLIENVVLLLTEALPPRMLNIHLFDFDTAPRFRYLSQLKNHDLYQLYGNPKAAQAGFDSLEELARHRLHELLPPTVDTLSEYNQSAQYPEPYQLLLINLDHYPDDLLGIKRVKPFFDHAHKAGIYTITYHCVEESVYHDQELTNPQQQKCLAYLQGRFAPLTIQARCCTLSPALFEFAELQDLYDFNPADCNKSKVFTAITDALTAEQASAAQVDFLQVPIAKSQDGRQDVYFSLGAQSQNYHAIITGGTGSGKSVLLNNLIVGIAQRYTANDIQLYLMDYKGGIEFGVFRDHPNCAKLFLDAKDKALAAEMVAEFAQEQRQRREHLAASQVKSIDDYNHAHPEAPLPHKVLIIDEAQCLFQGDYKQRQAFTDHLDQLTRQGRSDGLHIILVTQTLVGSDIPKDLLGQIPLRLSFKLNEEKDAWALFEFGNTVALDLDKQKHELLINTDRGRKSANRIVRANPPLAPDAQEIPAIAEALQAIRNQRPLTDSIQAQVVQGGDATAQPPTTANPFIIPVSSPATPHDAQPDWLADDGGE